MDELSVLAGGRREVKQHLREGRHSSVPWLVTAERVGRLVTFVTLFMIVVAMPFFVACVPTATVLLLMALVAMPLFVGLVPTVTVLLLMAIVAMPLFVGLVPTVTVLLFVALVPTVAVFLLMTFAVPVHAVTRSVTFPPFLIALTDGRALPRILTGHCVVRRFLLRMWCGVAWCGVVWCVWCRVVYTRQSTQERRLCICCASLLCIFAVRVLCVCCACLLLAATQRIFK